MIVGTLKDESSTEETNKITTKELLEKKHDVIGYFHNVTAIKESKNKFKYFNFDIQTENDLIKGVCFEPTLHIIEILSKNVKFRGLLRSAIILSRIHYKTNKQKP